MESPAVLPGVSCVQYDESYPGHGKVVIIAPVESHGSLDIPQVVLRNIVGPVMVVVLLVAAPIVGVEAIMFVFLLSVVEDSVGAGPGCGWSVAEDVSFISRTESGLNQPF